MIFNKAQEGYRIRDTIPSKEMVPPEMKEGRGFIKMNWELKAHSYCFPFGKPISERLMVRIRKKQYREFDTHMTKGNWVISNDRYLYGISKK